MLKQESNAFSASYQPASGLWKDPLVTSTQRGRSSRRGVAAVEFAIMLPVLIVLMIGTIEFCQLIYLREKALLAAHEGARVAIKRSATTALAREAVTDYLALRRVDISAMAEEDIQFSPTPETAAKLAPITVSVTIPCQGNTLLSGSTRGVITSVSEITSSVVMYKEYAQTP